jgi:site-specific recombinase XerD
LKRDAWNRSINSFLKECCEKLDGKPNLRSHSFRLGFITQLWKDTSDLEFVRQVIGHAIIDTISVYVDDLSRKDRQERM